MDLPEHMNCLQPNVGETSLATRMKADPRYSNSGELNILESGDVYETGGSWRLHALADPGLARSEQEWWYILP